MEIVRFAVTKLCSGCDDEKKREKCEDSIIKFYPKFLEIPEFSEIPMDSICSIVSQIQYDSEFLINLINTLVAKGRKDTPMILNAINPTDDESLGTLVKIISSITTSELCKRLLPAYELEECLVRPDDDDNASVFSNSSCISKELFTALNNNNLNYFKKLKESGELDTEKEYNESGDKILHIAAKKGKLKIVKYLIEECGAEVDSLNINDSTPLHKAIGAFKGSTAEYLISECKADITIRDCQGCNALFVATCSRNIQIVKYLIEQCKAKANKTDENGNTPLHIAVKRGDLRIMKYLVNQAKVKIDPINEKGNTPLHYAVKSKPVLFIDFLVKHGAKIDIMNKEEKTPESIGLEKDGPVKNYFESLKKPKSSPKTTTERLTSKTTPKPTKPKYSLDDLMKKLKECGYSEAVIKVMTNGIADKEIQRLCSDEKYFNEWHIKRGSSYTRKPKK